MYERILVPLDGSTFSESILPYVEEIAAKFGSNIELVRVPEPGEEDENVYQYYLHTVEKQVHQELKEHSADEAVNVRGSVLEGKPADEILRFIILFRSTRDYTQTVIPARLKNSSREQA